ncbi:MAG: GIY-YIG nuclease family protein, partial [Akkermansiaceae bacterium]
MAKVITDEDLNLLDELGVDAEPTRSGGRSAREQRIIAGYEEITRFVEEYGRLPQHGEDRDIFERIYAVRLDRIRGSIECRGVLRDMDTKGLLDAEHPFEAITSLKEDVTDYQLLDALGVGTESAEDITELKHVRTAKEKMAAEEVAQRTACRNFGIFKPLFLQIKKDIKSGSARVVECHDKTEVKKGDFFIIQGQIVYLAEAGEIFMNAEGREDCRLRVIFDNGTESGMLRRSLQKRLWEDHTARRIITGLDLGPLFSNVEEDGDQAVGHVYVLRSKSENPFIVENRKVIHKIGITSGSVKNRVANAAKDPTYLLAEVEIVETDKVSKR